jgi:hypothetical protein
MKMEHKQLTWCLIALTYSFLFLVLFYVCRPSALADLAGLYCALAVLHHRHHPFRPPGFQPLKKPAMFVPGCVSGFF